MSKKFLPPIVLGTKTPYSNQYMSITETSIILRKQDLKTKEIETFYKEYYAVESHDFVVGIVVKDDKILIINQYRVPLKSFNTEFVAGTVEAGESAEEAIRKELLEEAGIKANIIECLGKLYPLCGSNSTVGHLYLIKDFEEVSRNLEEYEKFTNLTVAWIGIDEFKKLIQSNEIVDGVTLAAWALFREII